jgi:thioredoxin-like negative regulator of GroEL
MVIVNDLFDAVFDVFASWAGPCEAMQGILKKFKAEGSEKLSYVKVGLCLCF